MKEGRLYKEVRKEGKGVHLMKEGREVEEGRKEGSKGRR